jgi:hypothetical protein
MRRHKNKEGNKRHACEYGKEFRRNIAKTDNPASDTMKKLKYGHVSPRNKQTNRRKVNCGTGTTQQVQTRDGASSLAQARSCEYCDQS